MRHRLLLVLALLVSALALGGANAARAESELRYGNGYPLYQSSGYPYGYNYGNNGYNYGNNGYGNPYGSSFGGWASNGLPGGDWQYSCRNIQVQGDKLYAECPNYRGEWERTGISYTQCRGAIMNHDGSLECGRRGNGDNGYYSQSGYGYPGGDFQASCRDIRVQGDKLYAVCPNFRGEWERTGITYTLCRGPIMNRDGNLQCARNGNWWNG